METKIENIKSLENVMTLQPSTRKGNDEAKNVTSILKSKTFPLKWKKKF